MHCAASPTAGVALRVPGVHAHHARQAVDVEGIVAQQAAGVHERAQCIVSRRRLRARGLYVDVRKEGLRQEMWWGAAVSRRGEKVLPTPPMLQNRQRMKTPPHPPAPLAAAGRKRSR